jgi:hypothetical protein
MDNLKENYFFTYILSKKNHIFNIGLFDTKRKIMYQSMGENHYEFQQYAHQISDKQINHYLSIKEKIPLTKDQFNKFLKFTPEAFEQKEKNKILSKVGLIEWLI